MATEGPPFFSDQQRLIEVVLATRALAGDLKADVSALLPQDDFHATLAKPHVLLILGASHSGKSTLLNALFRSEPSPVSPHTGTSRVTLHRGSSSHAKYLTDPLLHTVSHPNCAALSEFAAIDTPGANRLTPEDSSLILRLVEQSSLILGILSTANPWEPATWDMLHRSCSQSASKLVLVLQHADLPQADDLAVLQGHITDLAKRRLGFLPPIFPIACPAPAPNPSSWHSSGCQTLWNHLIHAIVESPERQSMMQRWKHLASTALRSLDDHIDHLHRQIGERQHFLGRVQAEIDHIQSHFRQSLESGIDHLAMALHEECGSIHQDLKRKLGILPSLIRLFSKDTTASKIETRFVGDLQSAIHKVGKEDASEIAKACLDHWLGIRTDASAQQLGLPGNDPDAKNVLAQARDRFVESLDKAAAERLSSIHLRSKLDRELRRRNRTLAAYAATAMIFLTLGATTGALGWPVWWAIALCALSVLFLTGAVLISWATRPGILESFHQQLAEACTNVARTMQADYEEALHGMLRDYADILIPLHRSISEREATIKPLQKRWQEIFLQLKTIP